MELKKLIRDFEQCGGKIKKLTEGKADGATIDCTVCAGSFSANKMTQPNALKTFIADQKARKKMRINRKLVSRKKTMKGRAATDNQKRRMQEMGITFDQSISMGKAWSLIGSVNRLRREQTMKALGNYKGTEILQKKHLKAILAEGEKNGLRGIVGKIERIGEEN